MVLLVSVWACGLVLGGLLVKTGSFLGCGDGWVVCEVMIWIVLSGRFGVGGFVGVCCFVWGLDSCVLLVFW